MERFILQKSKKQKEGFVCTDTVNGLVCQFTSHKFNDTQKFTFLEDVEQPDPLKIARILREMSDWLRENHYDIIF